MSMETINQRPEGRGFIGWLTSGHGWIPLLFVAGFLVLFAVTGRFVYLALTTSNGLVTSNAYERGLAYDDIIAAEEAQAARGWLLEMDIPGLSGEGQIAAITLTDRNGEALSGGSVILMAERMSRYAQQVQLTLSDVGNGRYEAAADFPIGGRWFVSVLADVEGERHFATDEFYLDAPGVN
jgi:nitrogen fixation protein FixH